MSLHVLEHLTPICLFCYGESPRLLSNWLGLTHIYMVVHTIGPPIIIAVHSRDVTILGEELFQLLGFSVTQIWPLQSHPVTSG
jgi:hypothetical protein